MTAQLLDDQGRVLFDEDFFALLDDSFSTPSDFGCVTVIPVFYCGDVNVIVVENPSEYTVIPVSCC